MSDVQEATATKPKSRMLVVCENIQAMTPKFQAALPAHIAPDKFVRTVLTTIQLNPDIANCDPQSIYNECTKAAADGLIIDGREAALVKYNVKKKVNNVETWVDVAKYMPMVAGLLKKARNSGEISSIVARCVYANDKFHVIYGDDEKLTHEPNLDSEPGVLRLAYMVARLKDGTIVRHVMTKREIEKRQAASRSGATGPWKSWPDEMWVKTVLRAGMKFLPASSDRSGFDELVQRDDDMYALDPSDMPPAGVESGQPAETDRPQRRQARRGGANTILDKTPAPPVDPPAQGNDPTDLVEHVDPETGVVSMVTAEEKAQLEAAAKTQAQPAQQQQPETPKDAATPATPTLAPSAQPAPAKAKDDDNLDPPGFLKRTPPSDRNPPPPTVDDVI